MKVERAKWRKGAERRNHNAEGFKETGYVILLSFLSKRAKKKKKKRMRLNLGALDIKCHQTARGG